MFVQSKSLKQSVYELMRTDIVADRIAFGSRIIETEFTERYNVSRTPIRNAIHRLESEGFLEVLPQGGIYVTLPLLRDLAEYNQIHLSILNLLSKYAVQNVKEKDFTSLYGLCDQVESRVRRYGSDDPVLPELCDQFHDRIIEIADQPRLAAILRELPDFWHIVCITPYLDRQVRHNSFLEHRAIVDALHQRDAALLCTVYHDHYIRSAENRIQAYQKLILHIFPPKIAP